MRMPEIVKYYMNRLSIAGVKSYIVGGFVRDNLMNRPYNDIDIFCEEADIVDLFPEGNIIGGEARQDKLKTISLPGNVELSLFRGNGDRTKIGKSIEEHCNTCDMTVNSIAVDIDGKVIDYTGGLQDIKLKRLRAVGKPLDRFREDWIRIPRLIRQSCEGVWEIEDETVHAAWLFAPNIIQQPVERFISEFIKALALPNPRAFLEFMWDTPLMEYYFPEYKEAATLYQNPEYHPEVTLKEHIIEVTWSAAIKNRLYSFLHDYGKASCAAVKGKVESGEFAGLDYCSFKRHGDVGAKLMPELFKRLKLSNDTMHTAEKICKYHMHPYQIMKTNTIRRFQYEVGKDLEILRDICRADTAGRKTFYSEAFEVIPEVIEFKPSVDGEFLMAKGFKQGPELGKVKKACENVQIDTGIVDPELIYSETMKVA